MLDSIFLLSDSGEVMLEKQWMGRQVDRSVCGWFWSQRKRELQNGTAQAPTVLASPTYYMLNIVREGITFLACSKSEMSPLLGIEGRRCTVGLPWRFERGPDQGQLRRCLSAPG